MKNTVTLVVDGDAIVSQHVGDLEHLSAAQAFRTTVQDLVSMYGLHWLAEVEKNLSPPTAS